MSETRRFAVLPLLASCLAGCATLAPAPDPFNDLGTTGARSFQLDVENRNYNDATIYVIQETGTARRVGEVFGNGTRSFQVPWTFSSSLSLRIDLLADGSCTTPPVVVSPGETLGLQIVTDFDAQRGGYCQ